MAVGDNFRVAIAGGLFSQALVNVLHYEQTTVNTSGNTDTFELAKAVNDAIMPALLDCQSQDVEYGTIEARSFPVPPTPMVGFDLPIVETGNIAVASLPPSVAAIVRKRTAFLGRKYRGRLYIGGVPNTMVSAGVATAPYLVLMAALGTALKSTITHGGAGSPSFRPMVMAYVYDVAGVIIGVRKTPITTCDVDKVIRSQRRREIGVGS